MYFPLFFIVISFVAFFAYFLKSKSLVITGFILAFVMSALRYDAGYDYFNYVDILLGDRWYDWRELFNYAFISVSRYYDSTQIYFVLTSFVYCFFICVALNKYGQLNAISLLCFCFFVLSFLTSMGLVRQFVAISIFFYAACFLKDSKKIFFLFLLLCASLFHLSAMFLSILIIFRAFLFRSYNPIFYVAGVVISYFTLDVLFKYILNSVGLYALYFENLTGSAGAKIFAILSIMFFVNLLFVRLAYNDYKRDMSLVFYTNMSYIGVVVYSALLSYGEHLARFSYYFIPFFYLMSSVVFYKCRGYFRLAYSFFLLLILSFSFFGTLYSASLNEERDFLNNYEFYFISLDYGRLM